MTLKSYVWWTRVIGLFSLSALTLVVIYINPGSFGLAGIALFYSVAFFALSAAFNLFLIFVRRKLIGGETAALSAGLSFRQGMLLAAAALGILALQNFRMLIWWDALLVIAGVFLIELFFLSRS